MEDADLWQAIEALYRSRFRQFERVARVITGDRESALEAVQEGFADALTKAGQFEGKGPLEGWVWKCVVNRARKTRLRPTATVHADIVDANGAGTGADTDLRARVARLPERQRLVIFLRYYADLEYHEIATALGIETGTVSATLSAAHASLRPALVEANA